MENWKKSFNNNKIVGAVFMDLSKAFDYIPRDLLIAKLMVWVRTFVLIHEALKTIRKH